MTALTISREDVWNIRLLGYLQATAITILIYDYCLTFAQEVSFVWNSRWPSTVNFLYLLTRYMPFIDAAFILYQHFSHFGLKVEESCLDTYRVEASLFILGIGISEIILMFRILVIWEKDRRLVIGLPIFFTANWIAILVVMYYFLQSLHFSSTPIPGVTKCYGTKNAVMLLVVWVLFMAFEIVMLGLLFIRGIRRYSLSQHMPLFRIVYRDGIFFYIFIVGISASNVIVILTLPAIAAFLLTPLGRVMHSILTARFVLEIRQVLEKLDNNKEDAISSDISPMGISFARNDNSLESLDSV